VFACVSAVAHCQNAVRGASPLPRENPMAHGDSGALLQVGIMPERGDIVWDPKTTVLYPAMCSFAGLIAGMFGVGGGIVKGPLMLALGVLPEVAAATSATMILFTACAPSPPHDRESALRMAPFACMEHASDSRIGAHYCMPATRVTGA
jgi:hypothetical protein